MQITNDIIYAGVNDSSTDLFEGQFNVPNGMTYNSYVILDEKTAVLDSVDQNFGDEWLQKIEKILGGREPDFLVVHHVEPDHSANILKLAEKYPNAKLVSSAMAFMVLKNYFGSDFSERRIVVNDGDTLSTGKHKLHFIAAQNVHWPEVIFSYDETDKVLFSADAFGTFGAVNSEDYKVNVSEWSSEAARYYFGIVGKFGTFVQTALKKVASLDIKSICPFHGPILSENLSEHIKLYDTWSKYEPENNGVTVAYTSVYGHTKKAVEIMLSKLSSLGVKDVQVFDLARDDVYAAIASAFRTKNLILATTTYCGEIFPAMREYTEALKERNFCNRKIGLIENGSWFPTAAKKIKEIFSDNPSVAFYANTVSIKGETSEENQNQILELAKEVIS